MCRYASLRIVGAAALLLSAICPLAAAETTENQSFASALATITVSELGQHVDVLADDSFEGRESGSRGGRATGSYLMQAMEESGVVPAGDEGGYFQPFGNGYRNVLGMIEGRDPQLKHEYLVIGAHYDHVGYGSAKNSYGPFGMIHNGADDNASGTSGVLEIMQAFAALPQPPRRSILFAFWDAEERGLLGSKHFVEHPTVPLKNIVMAFNSDMIGRLREQRLEVYGARTLVGLRQLVSRENTSYGMLLDFIWDAPSNSDHYSFYERNIPFLMLHTGLHDTYHRPTDDAELINREGMLQVSQLMFRVAYELAERQEQVAFRGESRMETNQARAQFERALAQTPPRLGVSWNGEVDGPGLLVTRVTPGSAADVAGMTVGDRILELDGRAVEDGDQFRMIVLAAASQTHALLERPGEAEPIELSLSLAGQPVRVGISWNQDLAAPSMVILTRVISGSAADLAGLAVNDRVYAVDDQSFTSSDEFGQLVNSHAGPMRLRVERKGVLRDVTVSPLDARPTPAPSADVIAAATPASE